MKPLIVMVHGAFHWGGCFAKVANLLARQGYPVAMPDLKSHGYDPARYTDVQSVEDYCAPAAEIVEAAPGPVVLLGHSLGGVTVSHLGERLPHKIKALVYLAALMLPAGKTPHDYLLAPEWRNDPLAADLFRVMVPTEDGRGAALRMQERGPVVTTFYADCAPRDIEVAYGNLVPVNAMAPLAAPTATTPQRWGRLRRVYIECAQDRAIPLAQQRRLQADSPGAERLTLDASHSPFFSQPAGLAAMLAQIAG